MKPLLKKLGLGKLIWFLMRGNEHIRYGAKTVTGILTTNLLYCYYRGLHPSKTFMFQGKRYNYFYHKYNTTWVNERTVEVPIIWETVKEYCGKDTNILEVGNVLSHYFSIDHDVIDKYEKADGVINQDVADFDSSKKYDLIVSISTLEHVGWDEEPRNPAKFLNAIENLEKYLAIGAKMVVSLPLGYNLEMDKLIRKGHIRFMEQYYLKRISEDNEWTESTWEDIQDTQYDHPFPDANALIIGIIKK